MLQQCLVLGLCKKEATDSVTAVHAITRGEAMKVINNVFEQYFLNILQINFRPIKIQNKIHSYLCKSTNQSKTIFFKNGNLKTGHTVPYTSV